MIPLPIKLSFVGSQSAKKHQAKSETFKGTLLIPIKSACLLGSALVHSTRKTQSLQLSITNCQKHQTILLCNKAQQSFNNSSSHATNWRLQLQPTPPILHLLRCKVPTEYYSLWSF
jgi:hypothetical protein